MSATAPRYRVKVVACMGENWTPPHSIWGTRHLDHESWSVNVTFDEKQPTLGGATGTAEHLVPEAPPLRMGEQFELWVGHRLVAEFVVTEVAP